MRPPAAPRRPRRAPGQAAESAQQRGDAPRTERADAGAARPEAAGTEHAGRTVGAASGRWHRLPGAPREQQPAPGRPGLLERLAEQTRARRRLAWRKVLLALGVLVLVGAAAWAVLVSPLLALDVADVRVSGAGEGTTVAQEDVLSVVAGHAGTPLARLDTGDLAAQIGEITTVRSAQVTRSWPHGLAVDITARVPVAAATTDDGLVLLDVEGVVVGSVDDAPEDLPRVTVPLSGERAGQTLEAVLAVLAELPSEVRAEVTTAGAENPASITLELGDGAEVRWGSAEESELKAAVLAVLREREAEVYDVTVPRSPTISR